MCGRYTIRAPFREIATALNLFVDAYDAEIERLTGRYNVAPSQGVPAIRVSASGALEAVSMTWGYLPPWKGAKMNPINARDDGLLASKMWRTPFQSRRCLLPVDGFYEWQRVDAKTKQPIFFRRAGDMPWCFAGLFNDSGRLSCVHITTSPNELVAPAHDRMPVMLDADACKVWVNPDAEEDALMALLTPYEGPMTATPVGKAVGSPRNQGPSLIEPIE